MILDKIENSGLYFPLHTAFKTAFEFIKNKDNLTLVEGRYSIEGERLYAIIVKQQGRGKKDLNLETHRKYIDIQYSVYGTDVFGWKSLPDCKKVVKRYQPKKDYMLFSDKPESIIDLSAGTFVIFYPFDAHAPLLGSGLLHKIVIKVARDW